MDKFKVTLGGREYEVVDTEIGVYQRGDIAVRLYTDEGWGYEPLADVTVNLKFDTPQPGCVWVKDYSENEGMADSLMALGFIEPTGIEVDSGWVKIKEYRLIGALKDRVDDYRAEHETV